MKIQLLLLSPEPIPPKDSLETGVAIIFVLVSDNKGGTDTSSVNVTIDSSGAARVEGK